MLDGREHDLTLLARERGRLWEHAHPADDGRIACPQGPAFNVRFWNLVLLLLVLGVGVPCIPVPLSTIALRTITREDLTAATSRYTLAQRVEGNIGCALAATLVARLAALHRVPFIQHISPLNPAYLGYLALLTAGLVHAGGDPVAARPRALALVTTEVNRQAARLA